MTRRDSGPLTGPVAQQVHDVLEARGVRDQPLIAAVSGGADSMSMLLALDEIRGRLGLDLVVAHFDHQLRPDSADDARWLEQYVLRLGLRFVSGLPAAPPPQTHIEAWARNARYAFLEETAAKFGARWIAVAHTANDQAETVLHHLLRGTGLRGAAGIPPTRRLSSGARIIRPCLSLTRQELLACLEANNVPYRNDPANNDPRFTRNRLRHELLPLIEERFNPRASIALCRLAEQTRAAARIIRRQATRLLDAALLEQSGTQVRLKTDPFARRSRLIVQEAAVVLWTKTGWPRVGMSSRHWTRIGSLLKGTGHSTIHLPGGVIATRRGKLVLLERKPRNS